MIQFKAFQTLVAVITGSRERETREHRAFMEFYHDLVQIIDEQTAREFGSIKVPTVVGKVHHDGYRMEMTVTDYLWWVTIVEDDKGRFVNGPTSVQRDIWDQLNKLVRKGSLTDEQRKAMLDLSDSKAA